MKREGRFERILILIYALAAALFGYGLSIVPERTLDILHSGAFGPGPVRDITLRFAGAMLGGLGVTILCLVPMTAPEVRRRIAVGLFVTTSVLFYFQMFILLQAGSSTVLLLLSVLLLGATSILAIRLGINRQETGGLQQRWQDQIHEAAAQQERNRLARDLHDSIKQQIFSIRVASATVEARWANDPKGAQEALAHVRKSAQEAAVEMQALLHQLRPEPLANAGLVEALREQCEALGYRTGATVEVEIGELPPDEQLPPSAQEALFRVAQEALSNVARHARATKVHVRLGREGEKGDLVLQVRDDGRGFDPEQPAGMGLRNMRDRLEPLGGSLEIEPTAGSGSRVTARLPLTETKAAVRPPRAEARSEEIIRRTASWALGLAFVTAVMVPGKVIPLAFLGPYILFAQLISLIRIWPWRSEAVLAGTALPRAFAFCLAFWSVAAGWLEPYTDPFEDLNNRAFNLMIALPSIALLSLVVQGFFRRLRRTPESTAKGRHIWLTILLIGFFVSLPLISVSGAPYAATAMCVAAASLFYMVWWTRENL